MNFLNLLIKDLMKEREKEKKFSYLALPKLKINLVKLKEFKTPTFLQSLNKCIFRLLQHCGCYIENSSEDSHSLHSCYLIVNFP